MSGTVRRFVMWVIVLVGAQLASAVVTILVPPPLRPFVILGSLVLSTMIVVTFLQALQRSTILLAVALATMLSLMSIFGLRRITNSLDLLGSVPGSVEQPALAVLGIMVLIFCSMAVLIAYPQSRMHRYRWLTVGIVAVLLGGLGIYGAVLGNARTPATMLDQVVQLERQGMPFDARQRQDLSFYLGVLGRESEAQDISTWKIDADTSGTIRTKPPLSGGLELTSTAFPWRKAIAEIAARERIVVIMEAHDVPQHREWIQQTLEIFRAAGFQHYAAEGLGERGRALKERGYPITSTGYYTLEPRFGNLLRRAISLDFEIHEYEAELQSGAQREAGQAATLAEIFASQPDCKLLIHAGPGHTFKQPVAGFGKWMAARLWDETGVEPYCIFQSTNSPGAHDYRRIVKQISVIEAPKILIPPPSGLKDLQFAGIPEKAIDAFVIHPLNRNRAPADRAPVFRSGLTQIRGLWHERQWPVVVGVYARGEPTNAIALDQIMLRHGETEFELWANAAVLEYRVHNVSRRVDIIATEVQNVVHIERAN